MSYRPFESSMTLKMQVSRNQWKKVLYRFTVGVFASELQHKLSEMESDFEAQVQSRVEQYKTEISELAARLEENTKQHAEKISQLEVWSVSS